MEQQNLKNLISIDSQEWQDYKQKYEQEMLKERRKIASSMKKMGVDDAVISKCLKISEAELMKLLNEAE